MLRRLAGVDLPPQRPETCCWGPRDLGRAAAPDEITILNFRHLLKTHDLCGEIFDAVNHYLDRNGIRITTGPIVDATIIHAPSSTRNENKQRDPEMHQTGKGNRWHFGAEAHIGVDSRQGVVHSVCSSAASVSDVHMLPGLLRGGEKKVWGDAYVSRTDGSHSSSCACGPGYDQPPGENPRRR